MSRLRGIRSWLAVAALVLLPSTVLAEVSVQLDAHGNYKRYWYLVAGRGSSYWRQVRAHLPPPVVLNPLGDTFGDGPPTIQVSPVTGFPWVIWAKNFGNIQQLVYSRWDGGKWTEPALINPGQALVYSDREPAFAMDQSGRPYLVWVRDEQTAKIYFSTLIEGKWSPAILLSNPEIDSRTPSIALNGRAAVVTYRTPAGPVSLTYETGILVNSAASLMDNPIPPLVTPPPSPTPDPGSGGGGADGALRN
jgi:hypothetical protein